MKRFFLLFFILSFGQMAIAQKVGLSDAYSAGTNFVNAYAQGNISKGSQPIELIQDQFYAATVDSDTTIYIFKMKGHEGFVMVSADRNHLPILGFSFDSDIDFSNLAPGFQYWINGLSQDVSTTMSTGVQRSETKAEWDMLLGNNMSAKLDDVTVGPLLYSKWNQDYPYNTLCPEDEDGPGGFVYVGCVATAMAQIMNYYRHPQTGTGSFSYNTAYGPQSVNFGQSTYNFDGMPKTITTPNFEISQLGYHCAVAVAMNFAPDGSGAQSQYAAYALKNYFKYSQSTQIIQKSNYSIADWEALLMQHIDNRQPLYYSGTDAGSSSGHAFVCDGYKTVESTKYFHFNWGWGGSGDAFVLLTAMNSGNGNFSSYQQAIINIYPAGTYPNYCSGAKVVTTYEGTIDDGSGPANNYQPNTDCTILLSPEHPSGTETIKLTFNYFQTNADTDVLQIFDGESESAALIGSYSGTQIPPAITSTGNKLFLKFTTGAQDGLLGWSANFTTTRPSHCSGITSLTEPNGSIEDGSGTYNYNDNSMCRWRIEPEGATSVTLNFVSFDVEETNDYVQITDHVTNTTIAKLSGNELPASITIPTSKVQIRFFSNGIVTGEGWVLNYTSSTTAVSENSVLFDLSIWPNPVSNNLVVRSSNLSKSNYNIELMNLSGQVLDKIQVGDASAANEVSFDVSTLPQGIYLIRVSDNESSTVRKFIKK